jgi:hypothetical protein
VLACVWLGCLHRPESDAAAIAAESLEPGDIDTGADATWAECARMRFLGQVIDALREVSGERPRRRRSARGAPTT